MNAPTIGRRAALGLCAGLAACGMSGVAPAGDRRLRLRVATDVNLKHVLSLTFRRYLDMLAAAFPDALRVELYPSGQLYSDRDLPRAVMRGDLDMAAPTISTLSRVVPECNVTALPELYGRPAAAAHLVTDGEIGRDINRRIAARLGAVVPGAYVDLGPLDLFCTAAGGAPPLKGLKVRVPSGAANVLRLRALGAYPVMLTFADVPIALSQGTVDAIESTAETVQTAKLWDAGIKTCIRQEAVFVQYVPLISQHFWERAPPPLRQAMIDLWAVAVREERSEAAARLDKARATCAANRVAMVVPDPAAQQATRARLTALTPAFVTVLGIDPDIARRTSALFA